MRGIKPQKSFTNFVKYIKKEKELGGLNVLDLGSGEGKNSIYLAELGCNVWGIEIADNAVKNSISKVPEYISENVQFINGSIGNKLTFEDSFFDLVIDVTSSNSLSQNEREIMLSEVKRVLKPDGYFFSRGLLKDGDKNAKYLLKNYPGEEEDTYIIPDFGLTERVFSKESFCKEFGEYFDILKFDKETHYTTYGDTKYKRNFYISYMKRKDI